MEQTASEPQTLQNENVRFTIHHKPACIVEFDIEAFGPLVKNAHKKAARAIAKEVTLPGFRKGKAPEEMIIKNYTKEVDKEWQQQIANACLDECQKLAKVPLLHRDAKVTYQLKSHSQSGALLTISLETEPKVPRIDAKQLQLKPVKRPEVNEDKINETIRQIQLFFANWQHVHDRPVQEGDFVLLDVDVIEDHPPTPLFSHTRFEVAEKSMAKWMRDLVLGKNTGDSMEGTSVPDADASKEDKEELKPKKVRVSIKSIDTATLPDLTDEFVQKLGASSIDDMRTKITNLLNTQADAHVLEAQREQVNEFLLTQFPFDLPATLIEKETQFRFRQLLQDKDFTSYWERQNGEEKKPSNGLSAIGESRPHVLSVPSDRRRRQYPHLRCRHPSAGHFAAGASDQSSENVPPSAQYRDRACRSLLAARLGKSGGLRDSERKRPELATR